MKKIITKACPKSVVKESVTVVYKYRAMRYKTDMLLHPNKMLFSCPCCRTKLRSFVQGTYLEYPNRFNPNRYDHTRQDVICPVCRSLPRHRILALWFEEHKELLKSSEILYFAPERSMTRWMVQNGVECTTADLYNEADLKLDIQATGLPDESYDMIISNHVLEHVDEFQTAIKEMYRVLRSGGTFICSFPMDPKVEMLDEDPTVSTDEERFRRYGQNDHKRVFGMKADQFLIDAGFAVSRVDGNDYPPEILPAVGPADYDMNILFCCTK